MMEKLRKNYVEKKESHKEGESAESCEKMCAERKLGDEGLKEQRSRHEIHLSSRTKLCQ